MIHLITKDLLIQKKTFLVVFLYNFFMLIVFSNEAFQGFIYIMGGVIVTYMFLITASTNDEKNNSDILISSMPVLRSSIVTAKYIAVFVYMVIGLVMLYFTAILVNILPLPIAAPRSIIGSDIYFSAALVAFAATLYYPLYFRFGSAATRTLSIFLFLGFFFLPRIIVEQYMAGNLVFAVDIINSLSDVFNWLPGALAGVVVLTLYLVSMKISQGIYSAKDL
ncbi:ABC-2 transporter permease [Dethiobacter alkaliphilus]|uniref:ABC-2 transporter permease n=1 Tax=Dethiobacter alkaliphilus AHT 1 TaxID=555088 RepID=C0GC78_DETAL|nr:ABC-2 transporter permease [Dethiobacter alkaliphilus]EEG78813.1 conserved hypothetical protein [Dethiobacter alkaliphilus AHT 1]